MTLVDSVLEAIDILHFCIFATVVTLAVQEYPSGYSFPGGILGPTPNLFSFCNDAHKNNYQWAQKQWKIFAIKIILNKIDGAIELIEITIKS